MSTDIKSVAQAYIDAGYAVVPLTKGEKRASTKWRSETYTADRFDNDTNIAIKCGEDSGCLVDVDLDCPEAIEAARALLPHTQMVHGRPSKPSSHHWFLCRDIKSSQFRDVKVGKGPDVCPSETWFPVEAIERSLLDCIEQVVLSDAFIERVLDGAFANNPDAERELLVSDRARLVTEITNLTAVAAAGGDIPTIAKALADRDKALKSIDTKLAKPVVLPDREVLKAALEYRKGEWRDLLRGPHVAQGRLILQHMIELPIRIPNEPKPKWMTRTRPGGLLVGLVQSMASPAGQGTSYSVQSLASLMPASWNQIVPWLRQIDGLRAA